MTTSVGIDIEEVKRFRSLARNRTFLNDVFDQPEILYCKSKGNNPQSLAGIFAAKEAVIKALSQLADVRYSVSDFAIHHDKKGAPLVKESNRRKARRLPRGVVISLSIAHTSSQALAVAIAQKG